MSRTNYGDAPGNYESQIFSHIMDKLYDLGSPGELITRGLIMAARDLTKGERCEELVARGASQGDMSRTRVAYNHVAGLIAAQFEGPHAGATFPHPGEEPGYGAQIASGSKGSDGATAFESPMGLVDGWHDFPAFVADATPIAHSAGGFIYSDWRAFSGSSVGERSDGMWMVHRYPTEANKVALQFLSPQSFTYAEIFQMHIADVSIAAKGLNIAVEVRDLNGTTAVVVGPRGRVKRVFKALGFRL